MFVIVRLRLVAAFVLLCVCPSQVYAQGLPSGVTPAMLAELKSLSPAQQLQLAKQYGVEIPVAPESTPPTLGEPGAPLTSGNEGLLTREKDVSGEQTDDGEVVIQEIERFGQSLFNAEVSTFAQTDNAPIPMAYRLGVGDELVVHLFGKENQQLNLQLGRFGDVNFPKLGSIPLAGLTFEDARDLIKTRVSQQMIGVESVVSMGRLRAISVFMTGDVAVPGSYSVSALTTVSQALFQAGGVTPVGSLRDIRVLRDGKPIRSFDVYDLLLEGSSRDDIRLQSGDVVFIPPLAGLITVSGEVRRPMEYELVGSETFADIVKMVGGFSENAFPKKAFLSRLSESEGVRKAITLDLTKSDELGGAVEFGDSLVVSKVGGLLGNSVTLRGAVTRPGVYGLEEGMRLSDLIGVARRDLDIDADLSSGLLVRQKNELLDVEVLNFSLAPLLENPQSADNLLLQEFDEIIIFPLETSASIKSKMSRQELLVPLIEKLKRQARQNEPVRTVSISGAVRSPGEYPLTLEASVKTLIQAAGGLIDSALLENVELRRLAKRGVGEVQASYTNLNLTEQGLGSDITLRSRDHVTVREIPDWSPIETIQIDGQVMFPGEYRIRKGEKISEIINRAGGFTENASLEGAVLTREAIAELETRRVNQFASDIKTTFAAKLLTEENPGISIEEISGITESLSNFEAVGRLLIDLPAAISGDSNADLVVVDGDKLMIPREQNTISVVGEVKKQGTHTFQDGLTIDDYLEQSAGLTRRADRDGVYIVKSNGSVEIIERNLWTFSANHSILDPGDTVVVPIDTQYKDSLENWRELTQIVYQSMVSLAAVASL